MENISYYVVTFLYLDLIICFNVNVLIITLVN